MAGAQRRVGSGREVSTNYYAHPRPSEEDDPWGEAGHIGKRNAAGRYCWSCRRTLCAGGESAIHTGYGTWLDKCSGCGAPAEAVGGACSFTWAVDPGSLEAVREVVDEYGTVMTMQEFVADVLGGCPIRFTNLIGVAFS